MQVPTSGVSQQFGEAGGSLTLERMARYLGTGRYLAIQTALVFVWSVLNLSAEALRWDPYPFILLNLAFSTQAAYAAPMTLLAQNRQADRDEIERDREMNPRSLADTEFLAREMAAIWLALEQKAARENLIIAVEQLTAVIEYLDPTITASHRDQSCQMPGPSTRNGPDDREVHRTGGTDTSTD